MASATDLIMLYVAMETTSITAYVLVGYLRDDDKSTEGGLKYFLFGAFSLDGHALRLEPAVWLYGHDQYLRDRPVGPVAVVGCGTHADCWSAVLYDRRDGLQGGGRSVPFLDARRL